MKKLMLLVAVAAVAAGCCSSKGSMVSKSQIVGADRDEHGCIASAGYVWSEVMKDCIRVFEKGIQLKSATDPQATMAAYVIFSADSTRAEVFLPSQKGKVLDRRGEGDIWEDAAGLTLVRGSGGLMVNDGGKTIYKQ